MKKALNYNTPLQYNIIFTFISTAKYCVFTQTKILSQQFYKNSFISLLFQHQRLTKPAKEKQGTKTYTFV